MATETGLIGYTVAWTLVGAFIFAVAITCASLVGFVTFANKGQQNKLFAVIIVGAASIGVTHFGRVLNYSPAQAVSDIQGMTHYAYWNSFRHGGVQGIDKPKQFPDEYRYARDGVEGVIKYYPSLNVYVESNRRPNAPTYYYYWRPIASDDFLYLYDDSRGFALKLPARSGMAYFSGNGGSGPWSDFHSVIAL